MNATAASCPGACELRLAGCELHDDGVVAGGGGASKAFSDGADGLGGGGAMSFWASFANFSGTVDVNWSNKFCVMLLFSLLIALSNFRSFLATYTIDSLLRMSAFSSLHLSPSGGDLLTMGSSGKAPSATFSASGRGFSESTISCVPSHVQKHQSLAEGQGYFNIENFWLVP